LSFLNRNTVVLFLAQSMFVSGTVLMVTIGGIVGAALAPTATLATLPMSLMVVGTALATIPASMTMQRFGRRAGFLLAVGIAMSGCLLGLWALDVAGFVEFSLAAFLIGSSLGFGQQFRFAAAESVAPERVSHAVSFILVGSIGGALLGPALAAGSPSWTPDQPFRGAFIGALGCYALAAVVLSRLRPVTVLGGRTGDEAEPRRPLAIFLLPAMTAAVLGGVVGQGVMTFIMTATPVSMHVVDGHSLADTAAVIRSHVIAMYLPSLGSAILISWLGIRAFMALGVAAMIATVSLGLLGHAYLHYWGALVLLGIGWNFLFVGGTTLLVSGSRPAERYRLQAVNDFSVFGVSALASLLAGATLLELGWSVVLTAALLPLLIMAVAIMRVPRDV